MANECMAAGATDEVIEVQNGNTLKYKLVSSFFLLLLLLFARAHAPCSRSGCVSARCAFSPANYGMCVVIAYTFQMTGESEP